MKKLFEAAISVPEAKRRGLALHRSIDDTFVVYTLYDTKEFMKKIGEFFEDYRHDDADLVGPIEDSIVGTITVKNPEGKAWGAKEVANSAAEKGYGPLMYDIAMAFEGALISDRDKVSKSALNVWKKYKERPDVDARELDDISDPVTPSPEDDSFVYYDSKSHVLNYAYSLEYFPSIKELFDNDKVVISNVEMSDPDYVFNEASRSYFSMRYDAGEPS